MLSGRKYRLKLTAGQEAMCEEFGNVCRSVWNTALEQRREYRRRGAWMNYVPQAAELADAKREHDWLKSAPSHILQSLVPLPRREPHRGRAARPQVGAGEQHAMPNSATGIDRGVKVAAATSDGDLYDREFASGGETKRYRRLQQKLARTKKGSTNRKKTVAAMNRIMGRVTDRRGDFCAYTANRLTAKNALVVLEDLKTKNMSKSAKGTVAEPGVNVAQKRGLNRAILDKGWHRMELALVNAAWYTGTRLVKVNPAYTSQRCSACGFVAEGNRESQAVFQCKAEACGHAENADVNSAKNIKAAGLAVSACGDLGVTRSMNQEPDRRVTGVTRPQS